MFRDKRILDVLIGLLLLIGNMLLGKLGVIDSTWQTVIYFLIALVLVVFGTRNQRRNRDSDAYKSPIFPWFLGVVLIIVVIVPFLIL